MQLQQKSKIETMRFAGIHRIYEIEQNFFKKMNRLYFLSIRILYMEGMEKRTVPLSEIDKEYFKFFS